MTRLEMERSAIVEGAKDTILTEGWEKSISADESGDSGLFSSVRVLIASLVGRVKARRIVGGAVVVIGMAAIVDGVRKGATYVYTAQRSISTNKSQ